MIADSINLVPDILPRYDIPAPFGSFLAGWSKRFLIGLAALAGGPLPLPAEPPAGTSARPAEQKVQQVDETEELEALLARGDSAWQRRAEGRRGPRAAAGPIGTAVAAYAAALDAAPGDIRVRERLLRALYFQGQFVETEGASRRAIHLRARQLAVEGVDLLAGELGLADPVDVLAPEETAAALAGRPQAAALFFWAAAHWGLWGETSGVFAAARQGVARRVRDHATIAALIDESYEGGGGHRILGRLHTEAPRIPLVTGWVDRNVAVASLERAVALAPDDPLNRLYLAEALLRFRPRRRDEAVEMIEQLVSELPRDGSVLEDQATLADARLALARAAAR